MCMIFQELVVTQQYLELVKKIERIFIARESVAVLFPYLSDRAFRIQQWMETPSPKLVRMIVPSDESIGESNEEFEEWISQAVQDHCGISFAEILKRDLTLVLIVVDGELWFRTNMQHKLDHFQQFLVKYSRNVQSLLAIEHDAKQLNKKMVTVHRLFQNMLVYPLYGKRDVMTIIELLNKNWGLTMASGMKDEIYRQCGGSFWLLKEAVREYRDNGDWKTAQKVFIDRAIGLAEEFDVDEQLVIAHLPRSIHNTTNQEVVERLKTLGWILEDKLTVFAITPFIVQNVENQYKIAVKDNELSWKGIALSQLLSPSENLLLRLLFDHANNPVSRDEIGKLLWSIQQEDYSQWAIDQTIKRLRDRLEKLGLPATLIRSVRGVGYEYRG